MLTGTYHRLRLPITASDREVIRATRKKIRAKLRRDPAMRVGRRELYRSMLSIHHRARELARCFSL